MRLRRTLVAAVATGWAIAGLVPGVPRAARAAGLSTVRIASGLDAPIFVAAPRGDARLFVVERGGRIRILQDGALLDPPFLDVSDRVGTGGEGGLLGLAFPPSYATDGGFFVYYTRTSDAPGGFDSRVSRFHAIGDPATATTADSSETHEEILFSVPQPYSNHDGGTLAIRGGFLYLGLGDGGSGGDPQNRAQDDASPFGKLLRFDLAQASPAPQVWAKGLRNPFRFSFDAATGDLYIGDVGQDAWEEIDVTPAAAGAGLDYGWNVEEGSHCYPTTLTTPVCGDPSLVPPVHEYPHQDSNCAVTGGSVYRGAAIPSLRGTYFFADYCGDHVWSLRWDGGAGTVGPVVDRTAELVPDEGALTRLVAIAEDGHGELDFVSLDGGVYRLVPEPGAPAAALAGTAALAAVARPKRRRARPA